MEGLSPRTVLLQESKKEQQIHALKTTNEQFCDWLNFDQADLYLQDEKPCASTPKRQACSSNINKSPSLNYRRHSPCPNWTRSLKDLEIQFEHFTDSSYYIQQYRRAKQLRVEERLVKLMQQKEKTVSCQNRDSLVDKNTKSSKLKDQEKGSPRPAEIFLRGGIKKCGDVVKPSLPGSGYFAGRKWVYPKDFARVCAKNIGMKCGISRAVLQKTDKQLQHTSTSMFLQGTGKPLNISANKNWPFSRQRTMCKSAPASRQSQTRPNQSGMWNSVQAKPIRSPAPNELLTCADLTVLLEKHSLTQPKPSLQTAPMDHSCEQVKSPEKLVNAKQCGDREEYEKIFRNVFDFYEQNSDSRSHLYINT